MAVDAEASPGPRPAGRSRLAVRARRVQARLPRRTGAVAVAGAVVLLAGAIGWLVSRPDPVPHGRDTDACPAKGPAGIVGLDVDSGEVRWTNIVGDRSNVIEPGKPGQVVVREDEGFAEATGELARTVDVRSGAVVACQPTAKVEAVPTPPHPLVSRLIGKPVTLPDGTRVEQASRRPPKVTATATDGKVRWTAEGRLLMESTNEGIVVWDGSGAQAPSGANFEALDPLDGSVRWRRTVSGLNTAFTDTHVLVLDQSPDSTSRPDPADALVEPSHISDVVAYRLDDFKEDWRVPIQCSCQGQPYQMAVADGLVLVPGGNDDPLTVLDAADGSSIWQADVPNPGRVGAYREVGEGFGAAVDEDSGTLVVLMRAAEPYRD